jgi:hypothetical protein
MGENDEKREEGNMTGEKSSLCEEENQEKRK